MGSVPGGKVFGRDLVVPLRQSTEHAPMNRRPLTTTATIELDLGTEAPNGVLTDGWGRARRFSGWIELAAAIEDWRTGTAGADPRPSAIEQPD
jgi:hypothetical protein